jgi:membrane protease YdiL (CAAX protease family)
MDGEEASTSDEVHAPADRPAAVPWTGAQIVLVLFLWMYLAPPAVRAALSAAGVFSRYYGPAPGELVAVDPETRLRQQADFGVLTGPVGAEMLLDRARAALMARLPLWVLSVAFPFQLAGALLVLYVGSGTRPAQVGLTTRHLGRNILAGAVVALLLTPAVLGVNRAVELLYQLGVPGRVVEHPLTLAAQQSLRPAERCLLLFAAVVAAPVMEELVFRGLLQPWLATRPWAPHAAMAAALAWAGSSCAGPVAAALPEGLGAVLAVAQPLMFVVAQLPVFALVCVRSRGLIAPAMFATATAFAALHSSVWPTPVALFVLAWGLGVLAHRTRSLVGPIVLHGLFNGLSCVLLLAR